MEQVNTVLFIGEYGIERVTRFGLAGEIVEFHFRIKDSVYDFGVFQTEEEAEAKIKELIRMNPNPYAFIKRPQP